MLSPKMQSKCAVDEIPIANSFEQNPSPDSSEPGTRPVTPELGQANWSNFGQPTPDTSPESIITAPRHRNKNPVRLDCQRDIGPVITSIGSKTPATEEIADTTSTGHYSQYLIHSEPSEKTADNSSHSHYSVDSEASEEASTTSFPGQKKSSSSAASVYNSFISLSNLAGRRNSGADNARVQDTIRLIKSLPTIRRTRVTNLTRKLTPS
ncbi:hypothetical protein GGR58DRAFT_325516 [Xylaria digitata]|nr:hypothetical protein GGR58DRAFT_325516 [Xylaria digitata]